MSFGQGLGVRIAEVCDRSIFFFENMFSSYLFRFVSFSISDLAALGSLVWAFDLLSFAGCHGLFTSFVSSIIALWLNALTQELLVRMLAVPVDDSMVYAELNKSGVCLGMTGVGRQEMDF